MSLSDSEDSAVLVGPGDIRDFNKENILPLPADELQNIRNWLQPTPYDLERSEFSRHLASYLQGTGQWLISTSTYKQWHQGNENGLIWIKGVPGSGKSVMAASIIHQLCKEEVPVLYFFFRQIIDANHQPVAVLRDWLCQLLPFSPPLQVRLRDEYLQKKRPINTLALSDLWKDLKFALSVFPKVYCVIDALDEMDQGNDGFLHSLAELGQWRLESVKVLITSRPVVAIESPLRPFHIPHIQLDERLVDKDIAAYVQYRLRNSSVPHDYWHLVTEAVPGRANGLFLYARLSMDAFVRPGADPQVVLETLPADLNVMYNNLLREHATRSTVPNEFQLLILQLITHATRPLRLLEVAEMAKATHEPFKFEDCSLKGIKNLVRATCGPLLQIHHDETVSVVHHSFTEFLKGFTREKPLYDSSYPILEAGPTNKRLAEACMDYLTSGCLDKLEIKKRSKEDEFYHPKKAQQSGTRLQFPFLEYAAANWYIHARRATLAGVDMSSFYKNIDSFVADNQRFVAWLDIDWPENFIQGLTPLHVAARTGLSQYASHLIHEGGADPNAKSHHGDPPLYWAALSGHADVVQILIENGADPDGEANEGYKPLHKAASHNRADVVRVLLAAGVDPLTPKTKREPGNWCGNAPTSMGHTPWMYACTNGQTDTVVEFLSHINDSDTLLRGLLWSAGAGQAACVNLILQRPGVDVNSKYFGETPLFKACCKRGDMKTIKVLLKAGADPNILCDYRSDDYGGMQSMMRFREPKQTLEARGYTALHALCGINKRMFHGPKSKNCVSLLLEAGANLHLKAPGGETALHLACLNNIEVVKLLLNAGADPSAETDLGHTILHSDGSTDKELIPLLLESGYVDVNEMMMKVKGNPLYLRLESHHPERALEILKYKQDVNKARPDGNRALHVLFGKPRINSVDNVVDALLLAGADPNMQNLRGETPLHLMRQSPKFEAVSKLVKAGADLEIRDLEGQTALFKNVALNSASDGKDLLSSTLIDLGARLDTRDNKGRTLLHQAVLSTSCLDYLIPRMDFHPSIADNKGNTLFHAAASKKSNCDKLPIYIYLKELGVDIDEPNTRGKTVLHKMCAREPRLSRWKPSEKTAFDYVIHECKNLNPCDIDGVQPLHIAAAISEDYVFKLLDAGADPFGTTKEGMTVLHVAARARQPGIIGLVLSRLANLEDAAFKGFINQKSAEGNTALHYACCVGRPESVDLLLDAGADPNLPGRDGFMPLRACVEFEVEQSRWRRIVETKDAKKESTKAKRAASIFLGGHDLPPTADPGEALQWRGHGMGLNPDSSRLDEILHSLVLHGAKITGNESSLRDAFHAAVFNQRDYTAESLLELQSCFLPNANLLEGPDGELFAASKSRLENEKTSLRQEVIKNSSQKGKEDEFTRFSRASYVAKLLSLRQYQMVEQELSQMNVLELNRLSARCGASILHVLAQTGLSNVLKRVCTREDALKFDDHEWCNQAETSTHMHENTIQPLLMVACDQRIPNMAVVRFLVEEMGINISATSRQKIFVSNGKRSEHVSGNSVLHKIAEGKTWWNVHEALPYLIRKGADLEVRNESGDTPLHIAVEQDRYKGVFYKQAVQNLLDGGADVNAVNYHGESCLSKAGTDSSQIKLLLSYGAKVSPAAIFSAIELQQVELLELYLAQGKVANLRRPATEKPERLLEGFNIPDSEIYPLFHAAICKVRNNRLNENDLTPSRIRMMTALLRNGADPYATFIKLHRINDKSFKHDTESESGPESEWKSVTCTVIHEILQNGRVAKPLLDLPSLQLEVRDASGQTLLLAASRGRINQLEELLTRGADVTAQDQTGKTIAHNLMGHKPNETNHKCLKAVFSKTPKLVHTPDIAGDTPLHYVLKAQEIYLDHIDLLLEHGADPLIPDSNGNTALHVFAKDPLTYKKRIEQFRGLGVDINARNKKGDSPLFEYIAHGPLGGGFWMGFIKEANEKLDDIHHLRFFKEAGADFFVLNNVGSSLLHVLAGRIIRPRGITRSEEAMAVPIEKVVSWFKFLTGLGLDPMLEDAQQRTCLDVAAACGNEHILKLFQETPPE
ncbi:uncharacterized protein N7503_009982 [Penicillium pulvis]|uniref:uncharacterized protein n=1 Tax=Penicillium pulvis TaxID=1562058 RepID=UPI002547F3FB|nr:uncharacterized protein N7503_009982 [Penicillium pulvis]KAJ5784770.1 hypothetical protein N7503_009982 [Penicillium pulvis]